MSSEEDNIGDKSLVNDNYEYVRGGTELLMMSENNNEDDLRTEPVPSSVLPGITSDVEKARVKSEVPKSVQRCIMEKMVCITHDCEVTREVPSTKIWGWLNNIQKFGFKYGRKMPQRRDNAGAECDFDMGMLFLNRQFLSYRRLATAPKNGVEFRIISIICLFELAIEFNFSPECGIAELSLPLFVSLSWPHQ